MIENKKFANFDEFFDHAVYYELITFSNNTREWTKGIYNHLFIEWLKENRNWHHENKNEYWENSKSYIDLLTENNLLEFCKHEAMQKNDVKERYEAKILLIKNYINGKSEPTLESIFIDKKDLDKLIEILKKKQFC